MQTIYTERKDGYKQSCISFLHLWVRRPCSCPLALLRALSFLSPRCRSGLFFHGVCLSAVSPSAAALTSLRQFPLPVLGTKAQVVTVRPKCLCWAPQTLRSQPLLTCPSSVLELTGTVCRQLWGISLRLVFWGVVPSLLYVTSYLTANGTREVSPQAREQVVLSYQMPLLVFELCQYLVPFLQYYSHHCPVPVLSTAQEFHRDRLRLQGRHSGNPSLSLYEPWSQRPNLPFLFLFLFFT